MVVLNRLFAAAILVGVALAETPSSATRHSVIGGMAGPPPVLSVVSEHPHTNWRIDAWLWRRHLDLPTG
jgi:hypothetical protein